MTDLVDSELVDIDALDAWIGDRLPGARCELAKISGGASNEMFEVHREGHTWVLRRPPLHPVAPGAHDMSREFRMLTALEGSDVPHPQPILLCDDERVIGARFYLMERVVGFTPRDPLPLPFHTDPIVRRDMAFRLVDGLAAIACVDWRASGLEGYGKPDGFLERQVGRWLSQLERYRTREIPGLDEVARWLEANRPEGSAPAIIHGDYQFINVMLAPDPPARLAAIVDWEQSTIGDPLLDLGWLLAGWSEEGEPSPLRFGSRYLTDREGLPMRAELAERYARKTGRDLSHLAYYVVLALFKLACVLEGSYHRFATGKSADPMHEKMGPLVLTLGEQAHEVAGTGRI